MTSRHHWWRHNVNSSFRTSSEASWHHRWPRGVTNTAVTRRASCGGTGTALWLWPCRTVPRDLCAAVASLPVWPWWLWPPGPRRSGDVIAGGVMVTTPRTPVTSSLVASWPPSPNCGHQCPPVLPRGVTELSKGLAVAQAQWGQRCHQCHRGRDRTGTLPHIGRGVTGAITVVAQETGLVACVTHHVPKCQCWPLCCCWCPQERGGDAVAGDTPQSLPARSRTRPGVTKGFIGGARTSQHCHPSVGTRGQRGGLAVPAGVPTGVTHGCPAAP